MGLYNMIKAASLYTLCVLLHETFENANLLSMINFISERSRGFFHAPGGYDRPP